MFPMNRANTCCDDGSSSGLLAKTIYCNVSTKAAELQYDDDRGRSTVTVTVTRE